MQRTMRCAWGCRFSTRELYYRGRTKADIASIRSWDTWNPEDRTKWDTQHDGLISLDPPYVYHVVRRCAWSCRLAGSALMGL
jgi:hypothetical protein